MVSTIIIVIIIPTYMYVSYPCLLFIDSRLNLTKRTHTHTAFYTLESLAFPFLYNRSIFFFTYMGINSLSILYKLFFSCCNFGLHVYEIICHTHTGLDFLRMKYYLGVINDLN